MPFSLVPDRVYGSIFEIEPRALRRRGITLLLADLDNTLAKYGQPEPDQAVLNWKSALAAEGVTLFLLSNSRKPARVKHYAETLGIPCQGHSRKPGTGGFFRAMEAMGRTPEETAMVGDQIFTDILGARRSGVLALMVEPIELRGNPGRYLRYAAETPFRALGRRNNRRDT
ncbi:YqeG family HAD IIIA-type phosphatase [Pseudoflavonifractor phocaeensis]|uniref:YqeG family HAD IIIA-type phosphatase n=1 Tax=Pseudoflavonifractor phocaeensis TaxID=1870988 RepID=UPI00210B8EAF|nr:YqeG family HAD IIIA-type phosphatase [Pseudoflavonifractor phocaeensis]MCQ4865632.1 YqeG family HAD IIIA-type phosphatase [Pseudoflavonifractor phocaeensis]